jgi:hypothetical protein
VRNVEEQLTPQEAKLHLDRHPAQKLLQQCPHKTHLGGRLLLLTGPVCMHNHAEDTLHFNVECETDAPEVVLRGGEIKDAGRRLAQPHLTQGHVRQVRQYVEQLQFLIDLVPRIEEFSLLWKGIGRWEGGTTREKRHKNLVNLWEKL